MEQDRRDFLEMSALCAGAAFSGCVSGVAAKRMLGIGLFFERAAETVRNVREFKVANTAQERLAIVDREEANVRATIPIVDNDSSIGWEPTMGYVCNRDMLEWKLGKLDEMRRRLAAMCK